MTHMLYFTDDVNLILSSLADELGGYSLEITVDDLQKYCRKMRMICFETYS